MPHCGLNPKLFYQVNLNTFSTHPIFSTWSNPSRINPDCYCHGMQPFGYLSGQQLPMKSRNDVPKLKHHRRKHLLHKQPKNSLYHNPKCNQMDLVLKCTLSGKIILLIIEILIEFQFQNHRTLVSPHVRTPLTHKEQGLQPTFALPCSWVTLLS